MIQRIISELYYSPNIFRNKYNNPNNYWNSSVIPNRYISKRKKYIYYFDLLLLMASLDIFTSKSALLFLGGILVGAAAVSLLGTQKSSLPAVKEIKVSEEE